MRILAVCPHFTPDTAPTGTILSRIVDQWAADGHEIHVVSALPWYRHHAIEEGWSHRPVQREVTSWGSITRLHPFPTDKSNIAARALAFGAFSVESALVSAMGGYRPDVVFAMSPPITLGLVGLIAARRWRCPLVFNIQDVFPDVAIRVGALTNPRMIRAAQRLERWLYRHSDAVVVLSEELATNVTTKILPSAGRVETIPNFVDSENIVPTGRMTAYREEHGLGDATVVMYAGNVGYSQSVDVLIETARRLQHRADVRFVINGGGSYRARLQEESADLRNLVWIGYQPIERLSEVLGSADIHTVLLKRDLASSSVPSKMYSVLAAGRPVVASVDLGTEVERSILSSRAGFVRSPEDVDGFVADVERLLDDAALRTEMSERARRWVGSQPTATDVARRYADLFADLVSAGA